MNFFPDFATNSRKEWRVSLFQSNLRKQIRKLPKILKSASLKIIHYCSLLFIRVLRREPPGPRAELLGRRRGARRRRRAQGPLRGVGGDASARPAHRAHEGPGPMLGLRSLANFWRARSQLYQNEILQENMRLTAFFKLYKICILLHRCNLKILAKIGLKNQQFSWNFSKILQFFLRNLRQKTINNWRTFAEYLRLDRPKFGGRLPA